VQRGLYEKLRGSCQITLDFVSETHCSFTVQKYMDLNEVSGTVCLSRKQFCTNIADFYPTARHMAIAVALILFCLAHYEAACCALPTFTFLAAVQTEALMLPRDASGARRSNCSCGALIVCLRHRYRDGRSHRLLLTSPPPSQQQPVAPPPSASDARCAVAAVLM